MSAFVGIYIIRIMILVHGYEEDQVDTVVRYIFLTFCRRNKDIASLF